MALTFPHPVELRQWLESKSADWRCDPFSTTQCMLAKWFIEKDQRAEVLIFLCTDSDGEVARIPRWLSKIIDSLFHTKGSRDDCLGLLANVCPEVFDESVYPESRDTHAEWRTL